MIRNLSIVQRILFLLFFILLPSLIGAQQQEYKDYMIEKGDTLWNISDKELKDPFLWPKVWKENPDIKNPDRIYPKQKIKIPLYLLQKEVVPPVQKDIAPPAPKPVARPFIKPKPEERPVIIAKSPKKEKEYLVNKNLLILSGYITDPLNSVGTIYDKPGEITNLTKGDYAYIRTKKSVRKGDKFYIIYPVDEVKHPVTGRYMGVRVAIVGTAEVVDENDPKIIITNSYIEVPVGSLIDNYYEIEPALAVDNPRKPDINGYVVIGLRRIYAHGNFDIVFIDKGEKDGLVVGDLLATTLQSKHKIFNGVIQIISTRPSTSAAIIRKAAKEIQIGDPVTAIKQE
jgi:LysM repeat protein